MTPSRKTEQRSAGLRVLGLLALSVAISGCGTIKNFFNDVKKENLEPPTP